MASSARCADIFATGFGGEVWTVSHKVFPLDSIRIETPKDLGGVRAGERAYEFTGEPAAPDFESIEKIVVHRLSSSFLGSQAGAMEDYWLGDITSAVPPPPDWKRSSGQIPPWGRTRATKDSGQLPFLNHAVFCWVESTPQMQGHSGVYLFRQPLAVGNAGTVSRATLRLATNARLVEAALNEHPLQVAGVKDSAIAEFDVTRLVQNGDNVFAVQLEERSGQPQEKYGIAFHLEIERREGSGAAATLETGAALVTSEEGDRLWGTLRELRGDGVLLDTAYGLYKSEWNATTGVLFPSGWQPAVAKPGLMTRVFGKPTPTPLPREVYGLPIGALPQPPQDSLLLTGGRQTTAKPDYAQAGMLYSEDGEGKRYSLPLGDVLAIYPPRASLLNATIKRPDPQAMQLYCRLDTTTGESIHGLLRQCNSKHTTVETATGQMLTVPFASIATIVFPYHRGQVPASLQARGPIALLPQVSGQEAYQGAYLNDSRLVQAAIFSINSTPGNLPQEDLADAARLTPERYPVLVSVDPVGEYLDTLEKPGDARDALVSYLSHGGNLVALSRGGAFRTAVKNVGGKFIRGLGQPPLTELLGLKTLRPVDAARAGAAAFDHPPNTAEQIFFQGVGALPEGLDGLPRRIELSPMMAAPFFPMVPSEGQGKVLYTLADSTGFVYGPALSIIPKGRGSIIVIDHLLWESATDEQRFTEQILPLILRWALAKSGQ